MLSYFSFDANSMQVIQTILRFQISIFIFETQTNGNVHSFCFQCAKDKNAESMPETFLFIETMLLWN